MLTDWYDFFFLNDFPKIQNAIERVLFMCNANPKLAIHLYETFTQNSTMDSNFHIYAAKKGCLW